MGPQKARIIAWNDQPNAFALDQFNQIIVGIDSRQHRQARVQIGQEFARDVVRVMGGEQRHDADMTSRQQ